VAGLYDSVYGDDPYWRLLRGLAWRRLRRWLPGLPGTRCLDAGCGTGFWGLRLIRSGLDADFLDLSRAMLDQAALKIARLGRPLAAHGAWARGGPEPVPALEAGASALWHASLDGLGHLPAGAYALVVGQGDPLGCAENPGRALDGLARLLAPGGVMALSVDGRWPGAEPLLAAGDVEGLEDFLEEGRTRWRTDRPGERYPLATFTPGGLRALCRARGLEILSLVGVTVLPLRRHRALLADRGRRLALARLEERLNAEESLLGGAAHLEITVRKPA